MILILVISYFLEVRNEEVTNFPFAYELCNRRVSFLCNVILKWHPLPSAPTKHFYALYNFLLDKVLQKNWSLHHQSLIQDHKNLMQHHQPLFQHHKHLMKNKRLIFATVFIYSIILKNINEFIPFYITLFWGPLHNM